MNGYHLLPRKYRPTPAWTKQLCTQQQSSLTCPTIITYSINYTQSLKFNYNVDYGKYIVTKNNRKIHAGYNITGKLLIPL